MRHSNATTSFHGKAANVIRPTEQHRGPPIKSTLPQPFFALLPESGDLKASEPSFPPHNSIVCSYNNNNKKIKKITSCSAYVVVDASLRRAARIHVEFKVTDKLGQCYPCHISAPHILLRYSWDKGSSIGTTWKGKPSPFPTAST